MSVSIGIILAVVLIALLVLSKRSEKTSEKRPTVTTEAQSTTTTKFHAVSIEALNSGCAAAKSVEGKRFLSSAAPRLPLPECDAHVCKCRFVHHADRRSGDERRGQIPPNMITSSGGYGGKERRFHDRRRSDEPRNFFA